MRSIIILLCLLLVSLLEADGSSACVTGGRISFTGDADLDFNGCQYYDDPGNFIIDHNNPEPLTELTDVSILSAIGPRSGWDLRSIYFHYLPSDDILQIGITCYGICGDADGDGNAGASSQGLLDNNGVDLPRLGQSEAIAILIDPKNNGTSRFMPSILIGKPSRLMDSTNYDFGIYNFTFGTIEVLGKDSFIVPGPRVHGPIMTDYLDTMARPSAIEFSVVGFSTLPGIRSINGTLSFSFSVFAGSGQDGDIGADFIPELVPTVDYEAGTIIINQQRMRGLAVTFGCQNASAVDSCGVCEGRNRNRDSCGVCYGNNEAMNKCGVCWAAVNQSCYGVVQSFFPVDISQFNIDAAGPYNIESAGDVNGDGFDDVVIGVPWEDNQRGRLHLFYLGANMTILQHMTIDSNTPGFGTILAPGDLFGSSLTSLKTQTTLGGSCLAVGAPGTNETVGAVHVFCLNKNSSITTYGVINRYNQQQIGRGYFGASLSITHLQETIVLIASATGPYISPYVQFVNGTEGSVYLIVLGFDNRILGVREVSLGDLENVSGSSNINITISELSRLTFGVQAIPIGDIDENGVSELVVTGYIWTSRPDFVTSLTMLPERTVVVLIYLNLDGSVPRVQYLPEPTNLRGDGPSLWGASVAALGDITGSGKPDIAIGAPRCQTPQGATGCLYVISFDESDPIYIRASTNALTKTFLPEIRFAGSLVSINNTAGRVLLATFDRTAYEYGSLLWSLPPTFMALQLNDKLASNMPSGEPDSPPGSVFVPFSDAPQSSAPSIFSPAEPGEILVDYPDPNQPHFVITPATSRQFVGLTFGTISEVNSTSAVASFNMSDYAWARTILAYEPYQLSFKTEINGVYVEIITAHLLEAQKVSINGGAESFMTDANTLKYTIKLGAWPFASLENKLVVTVSMATNSPILSAVSQDFSQANERVTRYKFNTQYSEVRASITQFCVLDGTIQPIDFDYIPSTSQITFTLPNYRNYIDYDPDLTIIDLNQDPTDSRDDLPPGLDMIFGIVVGVVILVVFAIVFPLVLKKYKKRKQHEKKWKEAAQESSSTHSSWTKSSNTASGAPIPMDIPLQQSVQL